MFKYRQEAKACKFLMEQYKERWLSALDTANELEEKNRELEEQLEQVYAAKAGLREWVNDLRLELAAERQRRLHLEKVIEHAGF